MRDERSNELGRLGELLIDQATEGLSDTDQAELDHLLDKHPALDAEVFARTAAAVDLALADATQAMPQHLAKSVAAEAQHQFKRPEAIKPAIAARPETHAKRMYWLALAASVVLAVAGWWPRLNHQEVKTTLDQQLAEFNKATTDASEFMWSVADEALAPGASGKVVWSHAKQAGFMVFDGLPTNEPKAAQYQLWIFDEKRDERHPVDGGVFNIERGASVVVPIVPTLHVTKVVLFAVTLEQPGGVVVSDRSKLALVAKVDP